MIYQFDDRAEIFDRETGKFRDLGSEDRANHDFLIVSDKVVERLEVNERLTQRDWPFRWMMGWRDIARSTDERTMISAVFPVSGADDTLSIILPYDGAEYACLLLSNLNSLILDFIAQQKVGGTHIRKFVISQFPVVPPGAYSSDDRAYIISRVLELTYTSYSMAAFADDLGYSGPPFTWDEDRRAHLRADLDAWYARAYGLTRDQLRYILDPADVMGPDYPSETFRVLKKNEIARYGHYRTQRLVLAAWDALEHGL